MWLSLALHVFNCSVFNADTKTNFIGEYFTHINIKDFVQIKLGQVIDNSMNEKEERNGNDSFDLLLEDLVEWNMQFRILTSVNAFPPSEKDNSIAFYEQSSQQFHIEIVPLPPKV